MSIRINKKEDFGTADYGWLQACYHFSFANYYNPERLGFFQLRVVNDDKIAAQSGFDTHAHRNMEIITYVKSGAITHKDSKGNQGRTAAGNIQVMTAGKGIYHSEHNLENEECCLYQLWIEPNQEGLEPQWGQLDLSKKTASSQWQCLISNHEKSPLKINANAALYHAKPSKNKRLIFKSPHPLYILMISGQVTIDGQNAKTGDSIECEGETNFELEAVMDSELLLIELFVLS